MAAPMPHRHIETGHGERWAAVGSAQARKALLFAGADRCAMGKRMSRRATGLMSAAARTVPPVNQRNAAA